MRVTPDQLLRRVFEHIIDVKSPGFPRDLGVHHDEQKKISEFFAKICNVLAAHRSGDFVSLFD
jgi:hypothetical protein